MIRRYERLLYMYHAFINCHFTQTLFMFAIYYFLRFLRRLFFYKNLDDLLNSVKCIIELIFMSQLNANQATVFFTVTLFQAPMLPQARSTSSESVCGSLVQALPLCHNVHSKYCSWFTFIQCRPGGHCLTSLQPPDNILVYKFDGFCYQGHLIIVLYKSVKMDVSGKDFIVEES